MKYFDLFDDMNMKGRWFLKVPLDQNNQPVEPWLFDQGAPVDVRPYFLPLRKPGRPLEFTIADYGIPVANARAAQVFERLASNDVQLIPIQVEGQSDDYFIVNAIRTAACVDEKASAEVIFWTKDDFRPDLAGKYRSIGGLRIDPSRTGGYALFRIKDWEVQLIASEAIKDAFEREGIVGAKFTPV